MLLIGNNPLIPISGTQGYCCGRRKMDKAILQLQSRITMSEKDIKLTNLLERDIRHRFKTSKQGIKK